MSYARLSIKILNDGSVKFGDYPQNRAWVINPYEMNDGATTDTFNVSAPQLVTAAAKDFQDYVNRVCAFWDKWMDDQKWGTSSVHANREQAVLNFFIDREWWKAKYGVDPLTTPAIIQHVFNVGVTDLSPVPLVIVNYPESYDCVPEYSVAYANY